MLELLNFMFTDALHFFGTIFTFAIITVCICAAIETWRDGK